jgi:hypothetical protein
VDGTARCEPKIQRRRARADAFWFLFRVGGERSTFGRIAKDKKVLGCWGYVLEDAYKFFEVLYHVVSTPVPLYVPPVVELD